MHLLVADDNVEAAESLELMLRVYLPAWTIDTVHDGIGALDAARRRRPDAAILDLNMPGMDGVAVAAVLRTMHGEAPQRLIALSGNLRRLDALRDGGPFDHLVAKPCPARDLVRLIAP